MQPLHLLPLDDEAFNDLAEQQVLPPAVLTPGQREMLISQAEAVCSGTDDDWPNLLAYNNLTGDKMLVILSASDPLLNVPNAPECIIWFNVELIEEVDIAFSDWDLEKPEARRTLGALVFPRNHEVFTIMLRIDAEFPWKLSEECEKAYKQNSASPSVIKARAWFYSQLAIEEAAGAEPLENGSEAFPEVAGEDKSNLVIYRDSRGLIGVKHPDEDVPETPVRLDATASEWWSLDDLVRNQGSQSWALVDARMGSILQYSRRMQDLWGMPLNMDQVAAMTPANFAPKLQLDGGETRLAMLDVIHKALREGHHRTHFLHTNAQGDDILCDLWLQRVGHHDDLEVLGHIKSATKVQSRISNRT